MKNTDLTWRQMSVAKKQFTGQLAIAMESREGYMLSAAKSDLVYGDVDSPEETYKKIDALTSVELMDVANEVFDKMSILTYK